MTSKRPRPRKRAGRSLRTRDKVLPHVISTATVLGVIIILRAIIIQAEQWPRIKSQFFDLQVMIDVFPKVLHGFGINMAVWGVALVVIAIWALVLAIFRSLHGPWFAPLRFFSVVYIDLLRGLPSLLLVLLFGFGMPALNIPGLPKSSLFWGALAMISSYSAYAAEVYRSGMDSVHDGQRAAAKALGLNQGQTLRYAILPQAVRNVIPSLLNLAVALQKDVALLSVLGIRDAVREAQIYTARTFNYSTLIAAAALFLVATVPMARLTDYVTKRDRERRLQRTE
ncbi:MAG: ABC transporter permease subunit [Spirochaetales bacterium]|uniref:ABC transporter permease subunit n=1 Tax=Candidatus Thalassospirochaeta sargassi TaxID=3119039 RepID=A0AAJ1MJI4_9SPIO|nr:ABC transporter permease subunit [Spirochaetales bacterium]